ncbi:MAG TPA: Ig-like domain-containing protein [Tepidisphaeraceae bacterium]|nr:Ig-like domain-containing protein [Tepidisphaeraceae bacterium]
MGRQHHRHRRRNVQGVERLEPRHLLSAAPAQPDLAAASDTGVSAADDVTSFNNATAQTVLRFTVPGTTEGAQVILYVDGAAAGVATATGTATTLALDPSFSVADGEHLVTARQTQPGDTESPDSPALRLIVDTAAPPTPGAPDLQPDSDTGASNSDNVTNDVTPTLSVAGAPYFQVLRNGLPFSGPYLTGTSYTTPPLSNGVYAFSARALDAAGNMSPASGTVEITVDTARPTASLAEPLAPVTRGAAEYTFSVAYNDTRGVDVGSIDDGDVVVVRQNGPTHPTTLVSVAADPNSQRRVAKYRLAAPGGAWDYPDNGAYSVRLLSSQVFDTAGNAASNAVLGSFNVDFFAPPAAPDLLPASDSGFYDDDNVTNFNSAAVERALQFRVANTWPGATVTLYADGVAVATATATSRVTTFVTPPTLALADGPHLFTARQTLENEPEVPASQPSTVEIDTEAPPVPPAPDLRSASDSGVSDSDNITNHANVAFDVVHAPAPFYRGFRDGELVTGLWANNEGFTAGPLPDGVHAFTLQAVDLAGNVSGASPALNVTVDTAAPRPGWRVGSLDTSFDGDGRWSNAFEDAGSVAVQPDGRIISASFSNPAAGLRVRRFLPDGSLDASFGDGGMVFLPGTAGGYVGLLPDAQVVVAGTYAVFRLSPTGRLDPSYGSGGSASIPFQIRDLAVAPDGKVLVVGQFDTGQSGNRFSVIRLDVNGAPDATFGNSGQVVTPLGSHGFGYPYSVVAYPDGRVLAAGFANTVTSTIATVVRYNADGTLDTTFGGTGIVMPPFGGNAEVHSVALLADGRIYAAGGAAATPWEERRTAFLARFTADGRLDTTFDGDGLQTTPGRQGYAVPLPGGDVFLVTTGLTLVHYDQHGRPDPTLPDGLSRPIPGGGPPSIAKPAITPGGDVVLTGTDFFNGNSSVGVFRVHARTEGIPDLQAASDTGASADDDLTNDNTPTFDVTVPPSGGGSYFRLYRNGVPVSGQESTGAYTAPPQPDGTWDYAAGIIDVAGNESVGPATRVTIDTAAPQVTAAFVGGTSWGPGMLSALQSAGLGGVHGYALGTSGQPSAPLPWANLNRLTLWLSEPLDLGSNDLRVHGVNVALRAISAFTADAARTTLTWTMAQPLAADKLLLSFADTATDAAGNAIRFGARPALRVDVLPGDVNRSGAVTPVDYVQTRARLGATPGTGTGPRDYSVFHDLNGNGRIDSADVLAARTRLSQRLPAGEPASPETPTSLLADRPMHVL